MNTTMEKLRKILTDKQIAQLRGRFGECDMSENSPAAGEEFLCFEREFTHHPNFGDMIDFIESRVFDVLGDEDLAWDVAMIAAREVDLPFTRLWEEHSEAYPVRFMVGPLRFMVGPLEEEDDE